jgi:hypothetical protein
MYPKNTLLKCPRSLPLPHETRVSVRPCRSPVLHVLEEDDRRQKQTRMIQEEDADTNSLGGHGAEPEQPRRVLFSWLS